MPRTIFHPAGVDGANVAGGEPTRHLLGEQNSLCPLNSWDNAQRVINVSVIVTS